jgi:PAS domain S-box-containing protein
VRPAETLDDSHRHRLEATAARLSALESLSIQLMAEREPRAMAERFLDMASGIVGASQAAIGVLNEGGDQIEHLAARGFDAERLRAEAFDFRRLPGSLLFAQGPLRSSASDGELQRFPRAHTVRTSFLGLPIRRGLRLFGWLYFAGKREASEFTEGDERVACAMASQFAVAHENLGLYRTVQDDAARLLEATREQARAQKALAEEAVRRRILFEEARDGVFVVDAAGRITESNRSFASMLRCSPEEALSLSPAEWHPIYAQAPLAQAGQGTFEARVPRCDGTSFEAQVSYNVAHWEGRTLLFNVCRDISERKRDEQALIESAVELRNLSRRLAESEEAVRRRIAGELHDRVGGSITALNLNLAVLRRNLPPQCGEAFARRLDDSLGILAETTRAIRELMADMRPPVLDDYGLAAALRWYGKQFAQRTGLQVSVAAEPEEPRLPGEKEISLFRLVQEALTNTVKHANAQSVRIALAREDGTITLTVADDGEGFEPSPTKGTGRNPTWGIVSMRERAEALGGTLRIDSAPGQGTRLTVRLKESP